MKKLYFTLIMIISFAFNFVYSQNVGINTTGAAPDAGAGLDVNFTNKGMLIPRVNIANLATIAPITGSTTTSMLVYNTNATTGVGYYYWNGSAWVRFATSGDAWEITGNAGTNPTNNFLGTTDNQALRFRTNNANRFEMSTDGRLRSYGNGSAGAPAYSWTTDTDIGMYRIGANILGFSTAGNERMRILASGKVAVNSTVTFAASTFFSAATGNNNAIDGNASGTGRAVYGQNTGTGYGVYGLTDNVDGIAVGAANISTNPSATALLAVGNGTATASTLVNGSAAAFTGTETALYLKTDAYNEQGIIIQGGFGSQWNVGGWITGQYRKIIGNGSVNTIVKDLNEDYVILGAIEAPEELFQDFGIGKLSNGKATIKIDPILTKNINVDESHPIKVFVQLEGECNGVYVANKSAEGFDVIELNGGQSNAEFSYSIVATRANEVYTNQETGETKVSDYSGRFVKYPEFKKSKKVELDKVKTTVK